MHAESSSFRRVCHDGCGRTPADTSIYLGSAGSRRFCSAERGEGCVALSCLPQPTSPAAMLTAAQKNVASPHAPRRTRAGTPPARDPAACSPGPDDTLYVSPLLRCHPQESGVHTPHRSPRRLAHLDALLPLLAVLSQHHLHLCQRTTIHSRT